MTRSPETAAASDLPLFRSEWRCLNRRLGVGSALMLLGMAPMMMTTASAEIQTLASGPAPHAAVIPAQSPQPDDAAATDTPTPPAPAYEQYPALTLGDERMQAVVMLPSENENSYYRGVRFEPSGVVYEVRYRGHTFFGPFHGGKHNPIGHDHIAGTAEEFDLENPASYNEAQPGETFLKIGVGELRRNSEKPYAFSINHEVVRRAPFRVGYDDRSITFRQEFEGPRGWAYRYVKVLTLDSEKGTLHIRRGLENTGTRPIDSLHYGHQFINIDGEKAVGPNFALEFGYPLQPEGLKPSLPVKIEDRSVTFTGPLKGALWTKLNGFTGPEHHRVKITNTRTGAAVEIVGDQTPAKVVLFAMNASVCPEFFVPVKLAPGEKTSWSTEYRFTVPDESGR